MPYLLNHCSTLTLPCYTAHSTQSFCPIAPVGLRCPPPHRVIATAPCGGEINSKNRTIICMANPRRVKMVARQIRRELSDMLLKDKVLQFAVLPEAALGADRYLSSLTTISDVEVSADLQVVKVYVSVFGDERGREVAVAGLKSKAKYVRGQLGKRMKLRLTPEVRFLEDESIERGSRVITILDRIKDENKEKAIEDGDHQPGEFADASNDVDVVERESGADASNDVVERESGDVDDEGVIYVE